MAEALILSSYVAASRVGGQAQVLALAGLGVEASLIPTVLFGRHPGLGPPGGSSVTPELFADLAGGVEASGLLQRIKLVITGYFAHPAQVETAARLIDAARAAQPDLIVVVDPVLGDEGKGLYVRAEVAEAVVRLLPSRADLLTPNLWELGYLSGRGVATTEEAVFAARSLLPRLRGPRLIVTSAPSPRDRIAILNITQDSVWSAAHGREGFAPNGTGDLFTALIGAALLDGLPRPNDLVRAAGGVADAVQLSILHDTPNLVVADPALFFRAPSTPVFLETL